MRGCDHENDDKKAAFIFHGKESTMVLYILTLFELHFDSSNRVVITMYQCSL